MSERPSHETNVDDTSISPEQVGNAALRFETERKDNRGKLYQAIVKKRHFAKPEKTNTGAKIPISVLGNNVIRLGDAEITLEGHELCVFNALILTRRLATEAELRALGFDSRAKSVDFDQAMTNLDNIFKRAIHSDLIGKLEKKGEQKLFILNPNVVISDVRRSKYASTPRNRKMSKTTTENFLSTDPIDNKHAEFNSNNDRDQAVLAIRKAYSGHLQVLRKVDEFKVEEMPTNTPDELQNYLNFASQFPLLDKAEEKSLFSFIETGLLAYQSMADFDNPSPEEEEAFINLAIAHRVVHLSNLKLVWHIIKAHTPPNMLPLMDLMQEGNIGLQKGIDRFDYTRGYKFSTFAGWWIRATVGKAVYDTGRPIRVPQFAHEEWLKIKDSTKILTQTFERKPTESELAEFSGISKEMIRLYRRMGPPGLVSLDWSDDDNIPLGELLLDEEIDMDRIADQLSDRTEITKLFASEELTDREKLILGLRHGAYDKIPGNLYVENSKTQQQFNYQEYIGKINTTHGMAPTAIGDILGITRQRVSQIEKEALLKSHKIIESFRNQQD